MEVCERVVLKDLESSNALWRSVRVFIGFWICAFWIDFFVRCQRFAESQRQSLKICWILCFQNVLHGSLKFITSLQMFANVFWRSFWRSVLNVPGLVFWKEVSEASVCQTFLEANGVQGVVGL